MISFEGSDGTKYFFSVESVDCIKFDKANLLIWYYEEIGKKNFIKVKVSSEDYAEKVFEEVLENVVIY